MWATMISATEPFWVECLVTDREVAQNRNRGLADIVRRKFSQYPPDEYRIIQIESERSLMKVGFLVRIQVERIT